MSLTFRWLGVAGIELKAGDQVLAIDPFFSRPSMVQMFKPLKPNPPSAIENLPSCNSILVTHSHYDHLMDVPVVLRHTGAVAYGSANTCQLLTLLGVPDAQAKQVRVGDKLYLGAFQVEVIFGQHSSIPFGQLFNGSLRPGLRPPLYVTDFRMDVCLGYWITVMGIQLLICASEPHPAEILFTVAQESKNYYTHLLKGSGPSVFIPIHWDNFTRPLSKPVHRFSRPGRLPLWQIARLARQVLPQVEVIIPEIFREYTLGG
jgi:L-ascorbate metabolism protein UlaG (beta-lactamase superfamily)